MKLNRLTRVSLIAQAVCGLLLAGLCPCSWAARTLSKSAAAPLACSRCATPEGPQHAAPNSGGPRVPTKSCCCFDRLLVGKTDSLVSPEAASNVGQLLLPALVAAATTHDAPRAGAWLVRASAAPIPTLRAQHVCLQI